MSLVDVMKYLFLGVVQGFTEPLPISSSGHLAIFSHLLNVNMSGNNFLMFAAFINFGSTLAIIIYFRKRINNLFFGGIKYIQSGLKKQTEESHYLWRIFYATLPLVAAYLIIGILSIEVPSSIFSVGIGLFLTGIFLFYVSSKDGNTSIKRLSIMSALLVGIAQAIAVLPGISRSGATMGMLLILGYNKKEAFNFSFIMFIPASIGGLLVSLYSIIFNTSTTLFGIIVMLLSLVLSFVFTMLGLVILKKTVMESKLIYFSIYCLVVSFIIMIIYIV